MIPFFLLESNVSDSGLKQTIDSIDNSKGF